MINVILGLLTFIYRRRAYLLEKEKLRIEQARHDGEKSRERLLLNVLGTSKQACGEAFILCTQFAISNLLRYEVAIRRLSVRFIFVKYPTSKASIREFFFYFLLGQSRFVLTISFESGTRASMTPFAEVRFDEKIQSAFKNGYSDNCPATIRDSRTRKPIFVDGDFEKIEHGGRTYLWDALAVLPQTLWLQAEKEGYTFVETEVAVRLHDSNVTSNRSSLIQLTTEEIEEDTDAKRLLHAFVTENVRR